MVSGKSRGEHQIPVIYVASPSIIGNRQAQKKGRGERLPDMGVEEGAFASGPVLRGDGAHYFFDIFG